MHITKKNEYNYDGNFSRWEEIVWFQNLEYLKDVKKDLDAINKLIESDFKKISDKDFYDLVSNFYLIYLTKNDLLNILSKVNGIEYNKFEKLNSRMTFKDIVTEGHGRNFDWWEETYQIGWIVATSKDLVLNRDYNYSKEEIEQMVKKKQVISFGKYAQSIGMEPVLSYKSEEVEKINILKINFDFEDYDELLNEFDVYFDFCLLKKDDSIFNKEVYKTAVSMIRKRLNKKKVLNDCKKIILFLNDNIHLISEVVQNEYFTDENDKNKYLDLSEELTISHKNLLLQYTHKT